MSIILDKNSLLEQVKSNAINYVTEELSNVKLVEPSSIIINNKSYNLDYSALISLCNIIEVPPEFIINLSKVDQSLLEQVVIKMKLAHDKQVIFCIDNQGSVIGIKHNMLNVVPNETLVNAILGMDAIKKLDLRCFLISPLGVTASFINPSSDFIGLKITGGNDIYRSGINFSSSQIGDHTVYLKEVLSRMHCSNLSYSTVSSSSRAIRIGNRSYNEIINTRVNAWYEDQTFVGKIQAKIKTMASAKASYQECNDVYIRLRRFKDLLKQRIIVDLDETIPMDKICHAYKDSYPMKRSINFKRSATTPVNYYDLFNYVTNIGTHHKELSNNDKNGLTIFGGAMLMKNPDMLDVAPRVTFS